MNLFQLNDALSQHPFFVYITPEYVPNEQVARERLRRVDRSEDGLYTLEIERPVGEYTCFEQIFPEDDTSWKRLTRDPFTGDLSYNPKEPYYRVSGIVPSLIK